LLFCEKICILDVRFIFYDFFMHIDFDGFVLKDILNPNEDCVQVIFESNENPDIKKKDFVIFEKQIKYIIVDEHRKFKRVKVYFRGDDERIRLDFPEGKDELLKKFFDSVYNR